VVNLFHYQSTSSSPDSAAVVNESESVCERSHQSIDDRCRLALFNDLTTSSCLNEDEESILAVRNGEQLASLFFRGLEVLRASESCVTVIVPFICLYAYGVCSSSGEYLQPTFNQCEELRDSLCQWEWETAFSFGIALPDCGRFPEVSSDCLFFNTSNVTSDTELNLNGK